MTPATAVCPDCGSAELGRGRCRTTWQQLLRDTTPFRRYRCRACGHEGWTARSLPRSLHPAEVARGQGGLLRLGRPVEARDHEARWRGMRKTVAMVGLALLLGALLGSRLVSCQGQVPTASAD